MDKLDRIISKSLPQKGYGKAAQSAKICFFANKWDVVPIRAISVSEGVLKVSVTSSSAASELQMLVEDLRDFVNNKIGFKAVRKVRIEVGRQNQANSN